MKTHRDTKKQNRLKVIELLNKYCDNCKLRTQNYIDKGPRLAHQYCIEECVHGLEIQQYGHQIDPPTRKKRKRGEVTVNENLELPTLTQVR